MEMKTPLQNIVLLHLRFPAFSLKTCSVPPIFCCTSAFQFHPMWVLNNKKNQTLSGLGDLMIYEEMSSRKRRGDRTSPTRKRISQRVNRSS